jgi:hypothetical protein
MSAESATGFDSPPPQENTMESNELSVANYIFATATIGPARAEKAIPDAYRLVTKSDGNGNLIYVLQGYFTWTQGWSQSGGEWRDLETQDGLTTQDDVPFGTLYCI